LISDMHVIYVAVATKPANTPQAATSVYKVEEYYSFTEYSYYDLDPNVTKLRCPVPDNKQ